MGMDYQISELKTLKVHSGWKNYNETVASKAELFLSQKNPLRTLSRCCML